MSDEDRKSEDQRLEEQASEDRKAEYKRIFALLPTVVPEILMAARQIFKERIDATSDKPSAPQEFPECVITEFLLFSYMLGGLSALLEFCVKQVDDPVAASLMVTLGRTAAASALDDVQQAAGRLATEEHKPVFDLATLVLGPKEPS